PGAWTTCPAKSPHASHAATPAATARAVRATAAARTAASPRPHRRTTPSPTPSPAHARAEGPRSGHAVFAAGLIGEHMGRQRVPGQRAGNHLRGGHHFPAVVAL